MNRCRFPYRNRPLFSSRPTLSIILLLIGMALFALSAFSLLTHGLLFPYDQAISAYFSALDKQMPGWALKAWTYLGNLSSAGPPLIATYFCYRWLRRQCDDRFTMLLMSYGMGSLLFILLALAFNRTRPSLPGLLKSLPFPSFPSGHMIQTITLLLPLLYIYLPRVHSRPRQIVYLGIALAYVLLIGADRLLVNAHYLTDVLAGTGIGLLWGVAVLIGYELDHMAHRAVRRAKKPETAQTEG